MLIGVVLRLLAIYWFSVSMLMVYGTLYSLSASMVAMFVVQLLEMRMTNSDKPALIHEAELSDISSQ
jgi:hypothetical protein